MILYAEQRLKGQAEAIRVSCLCDQMVVIGGAHSANSNHLAQLCRENCGAVQFVENASGLDVRALEGARFYASPARLLPCRRGS